MRSAVERAGRRPPRVRARRTPRGRRSRRPRTRPPRNPRTSASTAVPLSIATGGRSSIADRVRSSASPYRPARSPATASTSLSRSSAVRQCSVTLTPALRSTITPGNRARPRRPRPRPPRRTEPPAGRRAARRPRAAPARRDPPRRGRAAWTWRARNSTGRPLTIPTRPTARPAPQRVDRAGNGTASSGVATIGESEPS